MVEKYSKWPQNIQKLSIPRPSKIYPSSDFWFENIPSGNPAVHSFFDSIDLSLLFLSRQQNNFFAQ
jgi:hypothetical protein